MFDILILAGIVLVALLTLSLIVARLYRRASKSCPSCAPEWAGRR